MNRPERRKKPREGGVEFGKPSTWDMTQQQLAAYAHHLRQQGWQQWEIDARLDLRREGEQ